MLPKVIRAYTEEGFRIHLGNPSRAYSTVNLKDKRPLSVSGGFTVTPAFAVSRIQRVNPQSHLRDVRIMSPMRNDTTTVLAYCKGVR
jgi:hypothetical protein